MSQSQLQGEAALEQPSLLSPGFLNQEAITPSAPLISEQVSLLH